VAVLTADDVSPMTPPCEPEAGTVTELESQIQNLLASHRGPSREQAAQLSALRTRRNELASPLCRVPFDVLQQILHTVVDSHFDRWQAFVDVREVRWPRQPIAAASQTCAYIRRVALISPALWAHIDVGGSAEWRRICLRRSYPCELIVHASHSGEDAEPGEWITTLRTLPGRTRELYLNGLFLFTRAGPQPLWMPWPGLRCLSMSLGWPGHISLDARFLGGQTAALTRLSLWDVALACTLAFPSLVSLCLRAMDLARSAGGLADFLRTIAHSPRLEYLHLDDVAAPHGADARPRPIVLPRLHTLVLTGWAPDVAVLLRGLPDPSAEARIDAETRSSDSVPNPFQEEVERRMRQMGGLCTHAEDLGAGWRR
jgi:hypothetical protein